MSLQEADIGDFGSTGPGSFKESQEVSSHLNFLHFFSGNFIRKIKQENIFFLYVEIITSLRNLKIMQL